MYLSTATLVYLLSVTASYAAPAPGFAGSTTSNSISSIPPGQLSSGGDSISSSIKTFDNNVQCTHNNVLFPGRTDPALFSDRFDSIGKCLDSFGNATDFQERECGGKTYYGSRVLYSSWKDCFGAVKNGLQNQGSSYEGAECVNKVGWAKCTVGIR